MLEIPCQLDKILSRNDNERINVPPHKGIFYGQSHIANDVLSGTRNKRNSSNRKTIKGTGDGTFEVETSRDRNGTFDPKYNCISYIKSGTH